MKTCPETNSYRLSILKLQILRHFLQITSNCSGLLRELGRSEPCPLTPITRTSLLPQQHFSHDCVPPYPEADSAIIIGDETV